MPRRPQKRRRRSFAKWESSTSLTTKKIRSGGETARKLTPGGLGCDHVIEVGGPATIRQSFQCVARGGVINVIGFLAGQIQGLGDPTFLEPLVRACVVRGVEVGSRQQLEDMIKAIECQDIKPVLDSVEFSLKELKQVYERVWKEHFGKAVITGISEARCLDT